MKTLLSHQELKNIADKNGVQFDRIKTSSNALEDKLIGLGLVKDDSEAVQKIYGNLGLPR